MKTLLLLAAIAPVFAADPPGLVIWKNAELKGFEKKLSPKIDEHKNAAENLIKFDGYRTMVVHREGDGEAELHEHEADVFIVQSGEATLLVGGTAIKNGRITAPSEVRGPSIEGTVVKKELGPGDIVNIPANIPHQVLVPAGKQFTYFVVKEPK